MAMYTNIGGSNKLLANSSTEMSGGGVYAIHKVC